MVEQSFDQSEGRYLVNWSIDGLVKQLVNRFISQLNNMLHLSYLLIIRWLVLHSKAPKSGEILIFICLQKDGKQWCDAPKFYCTHYNGWPQWLLSSFVDPSIVWHLSGDKHQNLSRLRLPNISKWYYYPQTKGPLIWRKAS